jgi:penicillin-binding protein 1C
LSWFIPGKSPITRCEIHRQVVLDTRTNRRSCNPKSKYNKTEVYEFWPSDLAVLFEEAGLKRRVPPPYSKSCHQPLEDQKRSVISVTSPKKNVTYAVRADEIEREQIALIATSDADARILHWFVDTRHIGSTAPGQTLFWTPRPGAFSIRVVDEQGRSDSRELKVAVVE